MRERKSFSRRSLRRLLVPIVAILSLSGGSLGLTAAPAAAVGPTVGYACAIYTNVSLFSGPHGSMGCGTQTSPFAKANTAAPSTSWIHGTPTDVIDQDGAKVQYGPAVMVSSPWDVNDQTHNTGPLRVSTAGTTNVVVQAKAMGVGPSPFYTSTPASADNPSSPSGYVLAQCVGTPNGNYGSVTISKGFVDTKLNAEAYPVSTVAVPTNAAAGLTENYRVDFTIDNVGDHGHMVFNERINNPDGSLTVNGAHMYLEGPIAFGDVIIGQVTCGHA